MNSISRSGYRDLVLNIFQLFGLFIFRSGLFLIFLLLTDHNSGSGYIYIYILILCSYHGRLGRFGSDRSGS